MSPMLHNTMLARTGVGFQAACDQTPQHDQFPTSNYSLLRGNLYNVFLGPEHTESHVAQWTRRRACDHPVSRSNPDIGYISWNSPLACGACTSIRFQYVLAQGGCLKKLTDLIMIYFILPKQPTNLQASFRIVQLVKRQASACKVVGSIPAQTTDFFGFLFLFPKKRYMRAFSQPETTNQPVVIFVIMRSEKNKNQPS